MASTASDGWTAFVNTPVASSSSSSSSSKKKKKKRGNLRKSGPSAFPQLPYERSLQLRDCSPEPLTEPFQAFPMPVSNAAQQTPAQTDSMADAMQQRLWRLQLQEQRAADDTQGQGQGQAQERLHHLSQHGGYMQREGQESLSSRRTTRSMLRGADTQTGMMLPCCQTTQPSSSIHFKSHTKMLAGGKDFVCAGQRSVCSLGSHAASLLTC